MAKDKTDSTNLPPDEPPAATPPDSATAPVAGPMTAPTPDAGAQLAAESQVLLVIDALLALAQMLGPTTPKGKVVLDSATRLTREFGGPSKARANKAAEQENLAALAQALAMAPPQTNAPIPTGMPPGMPPPMPAR